MNNSPAAENAEVRIGTSGWHYPHWKEVFYPRELEPERWLDYYRRHFDTAEINNSFYRLPQAGTLKDWKETVPDGFVFAVKASRYITHMKKLKDPRQPLSGFLQRAGELDGRLGPVLFQLPPRWHCNPERLEAFLRLLPKDGRFAFEFRDPSWFDDRVYSLLQEAGAAFCIYQLAGKMSPKEVTADFVYVRLHGPGGAYQGSYTVSDLSGWAGAFSAWARSGKDVYCYFDNDDSGHAPRNALRLKEMLKQ
jgi:uncharacterized protein YecE (DUF72 family)